MGLQLMNLHRVMGECLAGREALCDADEPDLRQTERSAEVGGMEGGMEGERAASEKTQPSPT